jgi:hypothetical protein
VLRWSAPSSPTTRAINLSTYDRASMADDFAAESFTEAELGRRTDLPGPDDLVVATVGPTP